MAHVEVALRVEVSITHIRTLNILAHFLPVLLNVAAEVILRLATLLANIHNALHIVLIILEEDFTVQNMMTDAHKGILEHILDVVEFNFGAILEFHIFATSDLQVN